MPLLSLILDGIIILLLAGTIFYAVRLSGHIKVFRNSRKELEKLLADLSGHIEKADHAIEGLRENARQSGRDLQALISEARALSDELQIISESGNSLAARLEKLADGSAQTVQSRRSPVDFDLPPRTAPAPAPAARPRREAVAAPKGVSESDPLSVFAIRDPEFDPDLDSGMNEDGLMQGDYEEDALGGFSSQAEKDLYEALRRKNKTEAGGVS